MKRANWFLMGILVMGSTQANELDTAIKLASGEATLMPASGNELQALKDRLKRALKDNNVTDWQALAMKETASQHYISLQELPTAKRGRGFFALKKHAAKNWLLQAPHGDSDLYTGKIASRLFLEGEFRAAQWNTVKRKISDMAHTPDTYWQAFTQTFAELFPDGKIIQIHGYDQTIRKTAAGETSDMIISAGHDMPPSWLKQTTDCLKKAFPRRVSLYPIDVQELGGTTNVQGQLLRNLKHEGFLHIEMSKAMRLDLRDNADKRKRFIDCL